MSEIVGTKTRVTMTSIRLTGDQSERIIRASQKGQLREYGYYDTRLVDLGIFALVDVPPALANRLRGAIKQAWKIIQKHARAAEPTPEQTEAVDKATETIKRAQYDMTLKYVTLTPLGKELVNKGRIALTK